MSQRRPAPSESSVTISTQMLRSSSTKKTRTGGFVSGILEGSKRPPCLVNHSMFSRACSRSAAVTGSGVNSRVMVRSVSPSGASSKRRYWSVTSPRNVPAGEIRHTRLP